MRHPFFSLSFAFRACSLVLLAATYATVASAETPTNSTTSSAVALHSGAVSPGLDPSSNVPGPDDSPASSNDYSWYGWQLLFSDVAALGMTAAFAENSGVYLGGATWALAPGVIHALHGNPGRGAASLGLRITLPVLGAVIGASGGNYQQCTRQAADPDACDNRLDEAVTGVLVGSVIAMLVDYSAFAWQTSDTSAPQPSQSTALLPKGTTIIPAVGTLKNGVSLGVSGTF